MSKSKSRNGSSAGAAAPAATPEESGGAEKAALESRAEPGEGDLAAAVRAMLSPSAAADNGGEQGEGTAAAEGPPPGTETAGGEAPPALEAGPDLEGAREQPETGAESEETSAEPEAETNEPVEAEAEAAEDGEGSGKSGWPRSARETVRELRAERRELREAVSELRQQLSERNGHGQLGAQGRSPEAGAGTGSRLGHLQTVEAVEQHRAQLGEWVTAVEDQLEALADEPEAVEAWLRQRGLKPTDGSGQESYDIPAMRRTLREVRRNMRSDLERGLPQRAAYLRDKTQWDAKADTAFPWLRQRESQEFKLAMSFLQHQPDLQQSPAFRYAIGLMVEGQRAVEARQAASARAKAASGAAGQGRTAAPPSALARGAMPRVSAGDQQRARVRERAAAGDLAGYLKESGLLA